MHCNNNGPRQAAQHQSAGQCVINVFYALLRHRHAIIFVFSCKHRDHPVIPSLSDAMDLFEKFADML